MEVIGKESEAEETLESIWCSAYFREMGMSSPFLLLTERLILLFHYCSNIQNRGTSIFPMTGYPRLSLKGDYVVVRKE